MSCQVLLQLLGETEKSCALSCCRGFRVQPGEGEAFACEGYEGMSLKDRGIWSRAVGKSASAASWAQSELCLVLTPASLSHSASKCSWRRLRLSCSCISCY